MKKRMSAKTKNLICSRVRKVRIDNFGDDFGSKKEMARAMREDYNTYLGYEKEDPSQQQVNIEFIKRLSIKFNVQLSWLLGE